MGPLANGRKHWEGVQMVTVQEWLRARKARLQNVGQKRERARQRGSRSKPAGQQRSKAKKSRIRLLRKKLMGAEYQRPAKKRSLKTEGCSGWNPRPRCRKTGQSQTKGRPGCGGPSQLNRGPNCLSLPLLAITGIRAALYKWKTD